jgi:ketosteroid isomerase-like protein
MKTKADDDRLRQSLEDYVAAWNARDVDRIAALFAENGRYGEFGEGTVLSGRAQIVDHLRTLLSTVSDLRLNVSARPFCAGDRVFFKWTMCGTVSGGIAVRLVAREPFELRGATVLVFEDGKISRAADSFEVRSGRAYAPGGQSSSTDESLPARRADMGSPAEDNIGYGE